VKPTNMTGMLRAKQRRAKTAGWSMSKSSPSDRLPEFRCEARSNVRSSRMRLSGAHAAPWRRPRLPEPLSPTLGRHVEKPWPTLFMAVFLFGGSRINPQRWHSA
jgi:hypothetical protein